MVELESFKHGGTNITAFRLVDPDLEDVQNVVQDWVLGEMRFGRKIPFQGKTIKVRGNVLTALLIYIGHLPEFHSNHNRPRSYFPNLNVYDNNVWICQ